MMMLLLLIMLLMTTMTWSTLSSNNPMTLSLIILMMAICSSVAMTLSMSTWHAMILFLIYVGGMMVMFSYFVSFSSNDSMWLKTKLQFIVLPLIFMKGMNFQMTAPSNQNSQILKLYMASNIPVLIMITMILLFMMIIVIKMVKTNDAPLRGYIN